MAKLSEEGVQEINQDMETTVDELIRQFEDTLSEEGYHGLHVSQEVVTDNAQYYTVKLSALETEASGYEHNQFYTIDKQTGNVVALADLFAFLSSKNLYIHLLHLLQIIKFHFLCISIFMFLVVPNQLSFVSKISPIYILSVHPYFVFHLQIRHDNV